MIKTGFEGQARGPGARAEASSVVAFAVAAAVLAAAAVASVPREAQAQALAGSDSDELILGFKVTLGGRYDDVRMCIASPAGTKGGPAVDISFFASIGVSEDLSIVVDVPVMRPILFGAAFGMLQFEPTVTFAYRQELKDKLDLVVGPSIGVTLHYGPDFESPRGKGERTASFFAMGPRIGTYFGLDFQRPGEKFNFQLGVHPYFSPLWGVDDPQHHHGIIIGGMLEAMFRFVTVPETKNQ